MTTVERLRALAREADQIAEQIESGEPVNDMAQYFAAAEPEPATEDNWREAVGGALETHLEALGYMPRERCDSAINRIYGEVEAWGGADIRRKVQDRMEPQAPNADEV